MKNHSIKTILLGILIMSSGAALAAKGRSVKQQPMSMEKCLYQQKIEKQKLERDERAKKRESYRKSYAEIRKQMRNKTFDQAIKEAVAEDALANMDLDQECTKPKVSDREAELDKAIQKFQEAGEYGQWDVAKLMLKKFQIDRSEANKANARDAFDAWSKGESNVFRNQAQMMYEGLALGKYGFKVDKEAAEIVKSALGSVEDLDSADMYKTKAEDLFNKAAVEDDADAASEALNNAARYYVMLTKANGQEDALLRDLRAKEMKTEREEKFLEHYDSYAKKDAEHRASFGDEGVDFSRQKIRLEDLMGPLECGY